MNEKKIVVDEAKFKHWIATTCLHLSWGAKAGCVCGKPKGHTGLHRCDAKGCCDEKWGEHDAKECTDEAKWCPYREDHEDMDT